eukprot:1600788-Rhodomonas_salina.1
MLALVPPNVPCNTLHHLSAPPSESPLQHEDAEGSDNGGVLSSDEELVAVVHHDNIMARFLLEGVVRGVGNSYVVFDTDTEQPDAHGQEVASQPRRGSGQNWPDSDGGASARALTFAECLDFNENQHRQMRTVALPPTRQRMGPGVSFGVRAHL